MKLGICVPRYGRPIEVGRILEVVRRAEERGLDSVWGTDHVIVPRELPSSTGTTCSIRWRSSPGWPASRSGSPSARAS